MIGFVQIVQAVQRSCDRAPNDPSAQTELLSKFEIMAGVARLV
jgi:hypothetical protein